MSFLRNASDSLLRNAHDFGVWWVVLGSGIASFILAFGKAAPNTPDTTIDWWVASYICLAAAALISVYKMNEMAAKLEALGATPERLQTARNQLAVLDEGERRLLQRLLLDDHLRVEQIRRWHPGVNVLRIHQETTFLHCDNENRIDFHTGVLPGTSVWCIHRNWRMTLRELLSKPPKWTIWARLWRRLFALSREVRRYITATG